MFSRDSVICAVSWASAVTVLLVFLFFIGDIFIRSEGLTFEFILSEPKAAGRSGGILPILVSTALIITLCVAISLPIALGSALFLFLFTHNNSRFGMSMRICLDVLASTPSIVFGLFGSALFCVYLGFGFSILSGGLTLACMVLPAVIRMIEEGLRSVPKDHALNGAALGISKSTLFFSVLLPAAAPAVTAALLLGIGRALSETAALLFTSGYVLRTPESLYDSGRAISIHIYDLAMNIPGGDISAYRSAMVLMVILLMINSTSIAIMNWYVKRMRGE